MLGPLQRVEMYVSECCFLLLVILHLSVAFLQGEHGMILLLVNQCELDFRRCQILVL